jgi:type I restriction enzyme S subunit
MSFKPLSDYVDFVTDKILASKVGLETYISTDNMLPDKGGVEPAVKLPTASKFNSFKKTDTLFSNIRTYFKKVWYANFDGGASPDVLIFRSKDYKKLAPQFLYYLLSDETFINHTVATAKGAKMPRGDKDAIMQYEVEIPEIEVQKKIAKILGDLDGKIALNTRINQTLEAMAQALFKSWFVDFDPVKAKMEARASGGSDDAVRRAAMAVISNKSADELDQFEQSNPDAFTQLAKTADLFPESLVESELGMIPEGWEVKTVGDVAEIIKGKSYKSSELQESDVALVTLKSFNRGGGYRLDGLKEYTGSFKNDQIVNAGDLIVAYTDVTQAADVIGKPAMVISDERYKTLVISLDVAKIKPFVDKQKYFLYCLAMTNEFQSHTNAHSTGTTVLHLSKNAIPEFPFVYPVDSVMNIFISNVKSVYEHINENVQENVGLIKTRDTLLPKLLSGEIDLASFRDREVGE